jgi:ElaB/YqjD/DUF883 family membrane-anchored ribosome-binding protein
MLSPAKEDAMTLHILMRSLAALGVVCVLAGPLAPVAPARAADTEATASEREAYLRENDGRLERLGRDLDRLGEAAGRTGTEASQEARKRLDEALNEVKKHWQALRAAGIAGWKEALDAYEKSLRDYERARDDVAI